MERKTNGLCISGFVISLVSLILCAGLLSVLSLILSIVGVVKSKKNNESNGLGIAGIIISAVSLVVAAVLIAVGIFTGLIGTYLGLVAVDTANKTNTHNSIVAEEIDDLNGEEYVKDFGTYSVSDDWEEVDHGSDYYVYCYEGTFEPNGDIPNNIMVSHDTNPYSSGDHMSFRDAILAQLNEQAGETDDLELVTGSGTFTDSGAVVYSFDMTGDGVEKIQYYIVGDHEYVCVSAMIWDTDAAEDDNIREVASDIVKSFEWEDVD